MTFPNQTMLAFVHIEKAAGQTFIRILENNFVCRHCRVAPLRKEHLGIFRWADLKLLLKINPFLKALAGHSIVPFSDLVDYIPNIRYITILRDPVKRYISHYQYWVQVLNRKISFEEFLFIDEIKNFQTKKIAGSADLTTAQRIIKDEMFLTGIVEEFDNFLMVLKNKIAPEPFDIKYQRKNVAKTNAIKNRIYLEFEQYKTTILNNNKIDLELYHYVKDRIFKAEKARWIVPGDKMIQNDRLNYIKKFNREIVGRVYRNLYIGPIVKIIRLLNGLKLGGSY